MSSRNQGPIVGQDFFGKVPRRRLDGDWFGQDAAARRVVFPIELEKHFELSPWDHVSCR